MEMTGEFRIPAPRQRVWEGLNDPEVFKAVHPRAAKRSKKCPTPSSRQGRRPVGPVKGDVWRQGDVVGPRPAAELHDQPARAAAVWPALPRVAPRSTSPKTVPQTLLTLCCSSPCRRQTRAGRLAADRLGRAQDGEDFFAQFAAAVAPEQPEPTAAERPESESRADGARRCRDGSCGRYRRCRLPQPKPGRISGSRRLCGSPAWP